MTESQAKTMLCCGPWPVVAALVSTDRVEDRSLCRGAVCMAWVKVYSPTRGLEHPRPEIVGGRCGLAGVGQ